MENNGNSTQVSPQEYSPEELAVRRITASESAGADAPVRKSHIGRNIAIIAAAVILLTAGVLAFIAFALPQLTGEPNPISQIVTGIEAKNTPEELVEQLEEAYNNNDRDGMAKLFLPDQSLSRNIQGGALQLFNGLFGLFNSGETPKLDCELTELQKSEDGETAVGSIEVSAEFPFIGRQSVTLSAEFQMKGYKWYFKDITG